MKNNFKWELIVLLSILTFICGLMYTYLPNPEIEIIPVPFWFPTVKIVIMILGINTHRPTSGLMLWFFIFFVGEFEE